MLITLSFKKSLIVEQFQGNYLKSLHQPATMYIVLLILSTQPFISIHVHVTHANAHQSTDVFLIKKIAVNI